MAAPEVLANPPGGQAAAPAESHDMAQLRSHAKSLETQLSELRKANEESTAKLTALEREKMSEVERVTSERDEARAKAQTLDKIQAENLKNAETFDKLYKAKLESLPPEVRAGAEALASKLDNPADRFETLQTFESTIAAIKPAAVGTSTQPAQTGTSTQPATVGGSGKGPVDVKAVIAGNVDMGWKPVPGEPGYIAG